VGLQDNDKALALEVLCIRLLGGSPLYSVLRYPAHNRRLQRTTILGYENIDAEDESSPRFQID
jgi:hypothetical protein